MAQFRLLIAVAGLFAAGLAVGRKSLPTPPTGTPKADPPAAVVVPWPEGGPPPAGATRFGADVLRFDDPLAAMCGLGDGTRFVLAHHKRVRVVETATRTVLRAWEAHPSFILAVAGSADGRRIATASDRIRVWDADTGRQVCEASPHRGGRSSHLLFSPDSSLIASLGDESDPNRPGRGASLSDVGVRVIRADTGAEHPAFAGGLSAATSAAFSPDGKHLAYVASRSFDKSEVRLRPVAGGAERTLALTTVGGWGGYLQDKLVFARDGRSLVVRLKPDGAATPLAVVDADSGAETARFTPTDATGGPATIAGLSLAPDGRAVVAFTGRELLFWNLATGAVRRLDPGPTTWTVPPVWVGRDILVAGNPVRLIDPGTGASRWPTTGHTGRVNAVAISADGATVATAGVDETVRVWDRATGAERHVLHGFAGGAVGVALLPGGAGVALAADGGLRVFDPGTGRELRRLAADAVRPPENTSYQPAVTQGLAVSPDGRRLATCSNSGRVRVWDTADWRERSPGAFAGGRVYRVEFAADSHTLRMTGHTLTKPHEFNPDAFSVREWDTDTDTEGRTVTADLTVPLLTPDGRLAVSIRGRNDGTLAIWRTADRGLVRRVDFAAMPGPVRFSPDGRRLAAGVPAGPRVLVVWDADAWRPKFRLFGLRDWLGDCAFTPDGRWLAAADHGGGAVVWDLAKLTGRP